MPVLQRVSVSLKSILLATDFSSVSDIATCYAKSLALNFRSSVEIAHVFDPSVVTAVKERQELGVDGLAKVHRSFASAGVSVRTAMPEGHPPYDELLRLAREHEADLIIAGTHSRSGLERLVLGSVAEQLIRNAGCPVLTVGPHARCPQSGPLVFRTIVYATDFSVQASKAAVYALSFAQDSGAHLYFCHIAAAESTPAERDALDMTFNAALHRMIPESVYEWCSPQTVVRHGHPAPAILELADNVNADLIVLGARSASFWLTHIEHGLTPDLLAAAKCPVMTVC